MRSGGLFAVAALVVSVSSCLGSEGPSPHNLTLTIHCPAQDIYVGDEIPIVFTITNRDQRSYEFDGRSGDRSGRMPEYELAATDSSAKPVPDPFKDSPPSLGGGLGGPTVMLKTGDSYDKTIALNLWSHITKPGTYVVAAAYYYYVDDPSRESTRTFRYTKRVAVRSAPIKIVVKNRSDVEMGRYIQSLVQELDSLPHPKAYTQDDRRERLIERLAYTCDKRVVPTMLDIMYNDWANNDVFWAGMALTCYLPPESEVKEAVLKAAKWRGLGSHVQLVLEQLGCSEDDFTQIIRSSLASKDPAIIAEAVGAAQEHPSDECMPRLIVIARDPNKIGLGPYCSVARSRAISAVAHNRTDEGVALLRVLLNDPNGNVRRDAVDAIRHAYRRHPIYPEHIDEEYTAVLAKAACDPNSPMWVSAVGEIARTRTIEGVEAIKTLLADPSAEPSPVRTDAGVRAIRQLLRSPDPNVQDVTRQMVGSVYRQYLGRPLRPDDFPDEFRRDPLANNKKVFMERLSGGD